MLKQMYISGLPKTFDEGVKRVKKSKSAQEGFAFLADATKIKYAAMINCELRQVGNEFSRKPLALAVPENSTLKGRKFYLCLNLILILIFANLKRCSKFCNIEITEPA